MTQPESFQQFIRDLVTAWVEKMAATCGPVSLPNKPSGNQSSGATWALLIGPRSRKLHTLLPNMELL
ncbi:hypothetical protein STEG23_031027 [Scotinomys teguina]